MYVKESKFYDQANSRSQVLDKDFETSWEQGSQTDEEIGRGIPVLFVSG